MGLYKILREFYKTPESKNVLREYMIKWRKEPVIVKIEKPTRLDSARSLGYKAKKGFLIVRIKVLRGGRKRPQFKGGRRSRHMRRRKIVGKSYQWIAEERVNKKFKNMTVLNSYFLAKDGKRNFFEVILLDPEIVKNYKGYEWLNNKKHRSRVFHGKTSAGRKSRGIRSHKGKGAEKLRPSLRAHDRKGK